LRGHVSPQRPRGTEKRKEEREIRGIRTEIRGIRTEIREMKCQKEKAGRSPVSAILLSSAFIPHIP
jgi:hypothetical protein